MKNNYFKTSKLYKVLDISYWDTFKSLFDFSQNKKFIKDKYSKKNDETK